MRSSTLMIALVPAALLSCSSSHDPAGATSTAPGTTAAGQGGAGSTTTDATSAGGGRATTTSTTTAVASGGAGGANAGGAGGSAAACVGSPGTFYATTDLSYDLDILDPVPMCIYRGKVVIVVNTAALCGFTPQYAALEQLYEKYGPQGLEVVGFMSNDFGSQAGDGAQISGCTEKYGLTFTQYGIDHVTDADSAGTAVKPRATYAWLGAQAAQAPANTPYPTWNFHKYLLSRDGKLVAHWPSAVDPMADDPGDPGDIPSMVESELAKPGP